MKIFQRPGKAIFEIGLACNPGIKRGGQPNQDRVGLAPHAIWGWRMPLIVVADGMGGHAGGAMASRIVIDVFVDEYQRLNLYGNKNALLAKLVRLAHQNIKKRGFADTEFSQMGSTVVAACLEQKKLSVVNVGDSRAYIIRKTGVIQLSTDQSWVAEQVRAGLLTEAEILSHPQRSRLSMSISAKRDKVIPVLSSHALEPDDVVLLCSDGLWASVPLEQIQETALDLAPQEAADALVELANDAGGPDNISVIIARQQET